MDLITANHRQLLEYSGQGKEAFDRLFYKYQSGRYCQDDSLDLNTARRWELDTLIAYLGKNSSSSWLDIDRGEIVGYLGMRKSAWDSDFWGIHFASIDHLFASQAKKRDREIVLDELLRACDQWCRSENIEFVSARIDANDLDAIKTLENHGFRYIETTVVNSYDLRRGSLPSQEIGTIRYAQASDEQDLVDMVEDAFLTHRFYVDGKFPKEKVDQMYREWVRSSLHSSDWSTIVLESGGKVRGFFIYSIPEELSEYFQVRFAKWRLAALGPKDRGSGYGVPLFVGAMNFLVDKVKIIDSGLTVRNIRSFNLHNKLGFKIQHFSVTMHKWI
jgi:RimJ/RimL family protein N-acetyltransferase